MSIKEDFLKKWADLRTELDEFALQFHLGKGEGKERLDQFKTTLNDDLKKLDLQVDNFIKNGRPYLQDVKAEIETFRVQIHLANAENKEEIDAYVKSLQNAVRNLQNKLSERFDNDEQLKEQFDGVKNTLSEQTARIKAALEGMKLQSALGEMDAKEELEKFKKNAASKIEELEKVTGVTLSDLDDKAQSLFDEIQTFFIKLKDELLGKSKNK